MNFKLGRVALLVVASLISLSFSGCGKSPENAADHFMDLLLKGKHLAAQEMLGKEMRSVAAALGGVSNQSLNVYYRSGNFKTYKLTEIERAENSVRYQVLATTADGVAHKDFIDLVREDETWKIARF